MSKAAKVLLAYYIFLGVTSLIFSMLKIHKTYFDYGGKPTEFNPMWVPTIIGGLICLSLTVPLRSFKLFVVVYIILWILRWILLYIGNRMGETTVAGKNYHFELIFYNYYRNVSRLDTHLPFVLYWFINYLFTKVVKQQETKEAAAAEPPKE
jgi:hypothetical protein